MPFTPFHFGPGYLIKSFLRQHFSFAVFIWSQVLIDAEVLWNMYRDNEILHSFFHTYLGSTVAALICILTSLMALPLMRFFVNGTKVSFLVIVLSSFIGAWSHVLLDSFMHWDMTPLAPVSNEKHLLAKISLENLHLACLLCWPLAVVVNILRHIGSKLRLGPH